MKQFDSLCDTFNVDNCEEIVQKTIEEKEIIKDNIKKQKYDIEDKEYIKTELQDLINTNRQVLEELAQCCKVGAPPRLFEVYASLSTTISNNIMDLMKAEAQVTNYQIAEAKEELAKQAIESKEKLVQAKLAHAKPTNNVDAPQAAIQNNYYFTSKELLKMALDAKNDKEKNTEHIEPSFILD